MNNQEDNLQLSFMNSFNAVHAFTELLKWIDLLIMRTYYNNNQNLNQPMNGETVFHHHSKRNQILILPKLFCYYYCCTFSCLLVFFFKSLFSPSKHIKIMFKVFKLTLNINIEGKVCSPHNVQFCETEQKPIRYDVNVALMYDSSYDKNNFIDLCFQVTKKC